MDREITLLSSGLFEVDASGAIWRIAKRHGRGVKPGGGYHSGATVSPCLRVRAEYRTRDGYLLVCATIEKTKVVSGAHRLVWVRLHGPIPLGMTINHRNGVKDDNRPENLELATMSEQRRHALDVLNARRHRPIGSAHPKTKLSEADVLSIRSMRESGERVIDIAARFGMKPKAITAICTRKTWVHI